MTTRMTLDQARGELAVVENELSALVASKCEASKTSTAFSKWRSSVDEKTNERERLAIRIEALEAEVEQEKRDAARADLLSRRAALKKRTAELARRITEEGVKSAAVLVQLAEEAQANAADVEKLNRELSDDEQLIRADHIARHRDPAPRKNLKETAVDLWVFEDTGALVGDQDCVVERSNGRGFIPANNAISLSNNPVVRKRFKQIRYLKPSDREYADPLASVLRLPRYDGPGMLFDFGHKKEPAQRRELVELIPVPDAPAKPAKSPDVRT
jgi:hypothetical protein